MKNTQVWSDNVKNFHFLPSWSKEEFAGELVNFFVFWLLNFY